MAARDLLLKTLFPPGLVSFLRYQLFLASKITNLQAISKENIPLKRCAETKIVMFMLRSIVSVINLKKNSRNKLLFRFSLFFVLN